MKKVQTTLTRRTVLALPVAAAMLETARLQAATIPRPMPALKIPRPGGQPPIELAAYKGKVVAMFFLLTTCPHCKAFSKALERVSKELGPQGLQIVGAAINDDTGRLVTGFAQETGATFPIGYVKQQMANEFLQIPTMAEMYMPQLAIIDRKGMVRFQHPGEDPWYGDQENNFRKEAKMLLAEKAGSSGPVQTPKLPGGAGAAKKKS